MLRCSLRHPRASPNASHYEELSYEDLMAIEQDHAGQSEEEEQEPEPQCFFAIKMLSEAFTHFDRCSDFNREWPKSWMEPSVSTTVWKYPHLPQATV